MTVSFLNSQPKTEGFDSDQVLSHIRAIITLAFNLTSAAY